MKKIFLFVGVAFLSSALIAQNVGIGTTTPTSRLEVKNPIKSTVKISSNNFVDTSQLIFSNRNSFNQGTDMQISNNRESGLRVSSSSDLTANNRDTIMQITPTGFVGIRTATPQYPLDVSGDMNVTGEIKANGSNGIAGDVLQSNGNGTMSWVGKEKYKKFRIFRNTGSANLLTFLFTAPADVTEIAVEIWGGGGQAETNGSGASGGYVYAQIPTTTHSTFTIQVGAGGGCSGCTGTNGNSSFFVIGSGILNLSGTGGLSTSFVLSRGTFSASGTYLPSVSYFGINGESAKLGDISYENSPLGYYTFTRNAPGGSAPTRPNTGGRSGWSRTNFDGSNLVNGGGGAGSEPGGGGGFPNAVGGHGQIIVYW